MGQVVYENAENTSSAKEIGNLTCFFVQTVAVAIIKYIFYIAFAPTDVVLAKCRCHNNILLSLHCKVPVDI